MNKEYINSLKALLVDEESALNAYRDMMNDRYKKTSNDFSSSTSSSDSGNIQEIAYEQPEDEEMSI